jgi:class 3 adenylate cyclase/tetratricopeptide (TPR) repeat protein
MIACPSCGFEAPDDFAFCPKCATALAAPGAHLEERKTVTTLFCDLVAFTAMSEAADPEDVDRLLGEYFARATKVIESHGGTVEKFIGDAVVGVFGVPAVHEDDPERAVRAGLRILEELEGLTRPDGSPLQARVGINTGEALVRLDVDPASGRGFLTGDAVNVAARLEAAAPPGGVGVGALTHELTARVIEYCELPPVSAKGKSEPVTAWLATGTLARRGLDSGTGDLTPLVGREVELSYLSAVFDKVTAQSLPQFALLVGEPGIGKSRLVRELLALVDARPQMTTWRQGFCPPFGEDITYGALADIVKGQAGIRNTDQTATVEAKLEAILPSGLDREWFHQRLRALVGLDAPETARQENFTAWLRFFEDVAANDPTVLVFEDLHWADEALLDFLEYLTTRIAAVPLLIVGTARPELFERQPGFASGGEVTRIGLGPLSPAETARLVAGLLGEPDDRAKAVGEVVGRCDGNPFYAEQSARLLADSEPDASLPDSVHAVIAARLDTLPADQKALLGDAAVVGSIFWDGAVAVMGGREPFDVENVLSSLLDRRLIRRIRESSMEGEREFAFVHALARDVAYGELPRAVRARKHAAVAGWIEGKAGDRVEDLAEILARHYAAALDLANAAGEAELADGLAEPAARYLELAGDRAWPLDVAAAARHYARALEIAGPDSPRRSAVLVKWAKAATQLGRAAEAVDAFEEAIARLKAEGDVRAAAVAQMGLVRVLWGDDVDRWLGLADEAVASFEADGPSPELVAVLGEWLDLTAVLGDSRQQLDVAERGLELSEQLGLPADAGLLVSRGCARCDLGDAGGVEDYRQALEICRTSELGEHASSVFAGVGNWIYMYEGFQASLAVCAEGLDLARRRGAVDDELENRYIVVCASQATGDWDRALDEATAMDPLFQEDGLFSSNLVEFMWERVSRTLVLVERGRAPEAVELAEWLEVQRTTPDELNTDAGVCVAAAAVRMALGDSVRALSLLTQSEAALRGKGGFWWAWLLPQAVRLALAAEDRPLAERLAGSLEPLQPLSRHAIVAAQALVTEARGEHGAAAAGFADAAARWHDFAALYEEAHALFGQGRCLVALGRAPEAAAPLAAAHEIFARLGAKPALAETNELLQQIASG